MRSSAGWSCKSRRRSCLRFIFHAIHSAVVVLTLLGFPIALVIAWAFEMTPDGMKRTENVSPNEAIPQWSARKFAAFIVTIALLAAALFLFQISRSKPISPKSPAALMVSKKSIAVLPFENLSSDKENAYFAMAFRMKSWPA